MKFLLILTLIALGSCDPFLGHKVRPTDSDTIFFQPIQLLTIYTSKGLAYFDVEIADTPSRRNRGLMFRERLEDTQGMVFIFDEEDHHKFWMKNTPISLDIIFFDEGWRFVGAAKKTNPRSLEEILIENPSQYVLEINAGLADQLEIKQGSWAVLHKDW